MTTPTRPERLSKAVELGIIAFGQYIDRWHADYDAYMDHQDAELARLREENETLTLQRDAAEQARRYLANRNDELDKWLAEARRTTTAGEGEGALMRMLCGYLWAELAPLRQMDPELCDRAIAAIRARRGSAAGREG